jgi:hypothetical protein
MMTFIVLMVVLTVFLKVDLWPAFIALFILFSCGVLKGDEAKTADGVLLMRCQSALGACDTLRTADQVEIDRLKDSVKVYKKALESPPREAPLVVWTGLAGGVGGMMGGMAANGRDGLAVGGIAGTVVGVALGLIVGDGR